MSALAKTKAAFFGRSFELSLTKEYVSRWGMVQAVRELIQNALDSESPFVYEFIREDEEETYTLKLQSAFTVLTPATLLLGATSKAGRDDAIGSFGEGYKIALLVLTREGYPVEVHNGDVVWRPTFRYNKVFGAEVLVVDEHPQTDRINKGLTFWVNDLSVAEVDQIRASCLLMQPNLGEIKHTQYGDILLEHPGELYVGNLFICKTELKYGYNILPKHIRLERDRQTVYSWELESITTKMWYETKEMETVAKMIQDEIPDVKYCSWDAPEMIKEECYKLFRREHPDALIASSPSEAKAMIEKGLIKTVFAGGSLYAAVSDSRSYKHEVRTIVKEAQKPHEVLTSWFSAHRSEMRTPAIVSFKELIKKAEQWRLK